MQRKKGKIYDYFRAALQEVVEEKGWGFQRSLAKDVGVSKGYVNDILNDRRKGSEEVRRKIAEVIGMDYEQMVDRGKQIVEGPGSHENVLERTRVHSPERAALIYRRAAAQFGIDNTFFLAENNLKLTGPPGWHDYINKEIGDLDLYDIAYKEMRKLTEKLRKELGPS